MTTTMEKETVSAIGIRLAGKYLTFQLANEHYGLEILKVQEIIGMMKVTQVPKAPPYVRGVVNLRGKVIPVLDLRVKFGLNMVSDSEKTCIIVLQIAAGGQPLVMGVIVDEVSEVLEVRSEQIEPPPAFADQVDSRFLMGMGKLGNKVVMLLDADRVLAQSEAQATFAVQAAD